jgi:DNA repair protein RadC
MKSRKGSAAAKAPAQPMAICVAITLNTRLRATGHTLVSIGTLNETVVHSRDVFRAAVALNAYGVLLVHGHPSGDAAPSENDHRMTRRIAECGAILQIKLLDHVIVGATGALFSFKEAGLL